MKKNQAGLLTKTNLNLVLNETFTSKEMGLIFWGKFRIQAKAKCLLKMSSENVSSKMSSEIIFFQHFVDKIQQKHFLYISNELLL